ncbi:hypothetical protein [Clostridium perfringens]|uniref:hypothetical protein n=1 Tax=Clostridium perfringens TaxID=1502 RepID=UPI0024BCB4F7|nr:hypothetical protein [Clostridium perfringens]
MEKYGIKSKDNNDILIFHALPNETTKFQWYISENINEKGKPIDEQIYESYTLSTEVIKRKNFVGKYLYCEYLTPGLNQYEKTEYIKLGLTIDSMINEGVIFDDISKFDEQGNIGNLEKEEILKYNSKKMEIILNDLKELIESKENNQDEKLVNKKAIKGIRKYRLGYDYLFLPKKPFMYKGDLIGGTSIMVLFKVYDMEGNEILFESEEGELKEQKLKLRNGEECYLCDLFYCCFDKELFKENKTFDFSPTMNVIMSNCRVAMTIISYTKDLKIKNFILEPVQIEDKEFNDIMLNNLDLFDVTDNKPAQSTSYIAQEIKDNK